MLTSSPILVCFAIKEEADAFRTVAAKWPNVCVLITGMGRTNSERAVQSAIAAQPPGFVFTCGFAGALNPKLRVGDVIFSTNAGDDLVSRILAAGAQSTRLHCATRIAVTKSEKALLCERTGADAVEMESGWIQAICDHAKIKCATVRSISDTANEDMPLDFNALSRPDQSLDFTKLAMAIARSPRVIVPLMRLRAQTRKAAESLARVLQEIIAA